MCMMTSCLCMMTSCCPDDVMLPYRNPHRVTSRPVPFTVDGRRLETSSLHRRYVDTLWWPRRIIVASLIISNAMQRCHDAMRDAMGDDSVASLHRTVTLRIAPSLSQPFIHSHSGATGVFWRPTRMYTFVH